MRKLWSSVKLVMFCVVTTMAIAACGGGSTTSSTPPPAATTLSGVAAAGAPIIGSVTIKDSTTPAAQTKTVKIEADGKYKIDVSDMKAPFAMRADGYVGGKDYHLYSAATQADVGATVNITPFTDLIIANIAGDIAANYFNNGTFSTLSKTDLDSAQAALKAKLQPILTAVGLADSIDLLRTAFNADHSGLDGVLDVLKVTVDPNTKTAEIKNIINNAAISDDLKSKSDTGAFTTQQADGVASGLTDLQAIVKGFDDFSALFATGLPAATNAQLLATFDQAGFMHDGRNLAAFLGDITTDPSTIGLKLANVSIVTLNPTNGTGEVTFDVIVQGRSQVEFQNRFKMVKKNNVWLMQGNQRIAKAYIFARSNYSPGDTNAQILTGLHLDVQDRGGKGIAMAIVKGPGLPTTGVTLINDVASSRFSPDHVTMDDATIDTIPDTGATYTIELRDAANAVMDTYTNTIRKRPYKLSELTAASFPVITAPTLTELRAFTGGNLTVTWTLPAGFMSDFVNAFLNGTGGSAQMQKSPLAASATTATLTIQPKTSTGATFTITNRGVELGVIDSFGRTLATNLF